MNDWDDIRFFLAVAREGSVSGAARCLSVNHSTVTRRIQGMETKHGVQLFQRVREGYEMTDAARAIYEQALAIELQSQQISRSLLGQDARLEGTVTLTMPHDLFENCLVEDLAEFHRQYPQIQLKVMVTDGLRNLANREADLAVRLTPTPPDSLIGHRVCAIQYGLYCHRAIETSGRVGIIVWQGDDDQVLPLWAQQHFPQAYVAMQVDDLTSMYAAVKAGFGIARMPSYFANVMTDKEVEYLPLELSHSDWSVWVLYHQDLRKTARIQRLQSFLFEALKRKHALFDSVCC